MKRMTMTITPDNRMASLSTKGEIGFFTDKQLSEEDAELARKMSLIMMEPGAKQRFPTSKLIAQFLGVDELRVMSVRYSKEYVAFMQDAVKVQALEHAPQAVDKMAEQLDGEQAIQAAKTLFDVGGVAGSGSIRRPAGGDSHSAGPVKVEMTFEQKLRERTRMKAVDAKIIEGSK